LLQRLLPGPVTLCFERSSGLMSALNPGLSLIGIRIPQASFIRDVVRQCGQAIALTSANISSYESSVCIDEFKEIHSLLSIVFDGGKTSDSREGSTVVDLSLPGFYHILRNGR
jgi:tRNA A37 threonylcarbamoyladenosine synthetase subunit TsaC/SUA5/YrdC